MSGHIPIKFRVAGPVLSVMDLDDLIGPLPAPLGRWMLRRMVARAVRYGQQFSVMLIRGTDAGTLCVLLRGADLFVAWDGGDLLALLPDTDRAGAEVAAERVRAATEARVGAVHWEGDLANDLLERAVRALEADATRC
jgi:hypothetical protein